MKKIKNLFKKLQDNKALQERLAGELTLKGNTIVWTYDLYSNAEELDIDQDDQDENEIDFKDIICVEEHLTDTYETDLEEIEDAIAAMVDVDEEEFDYSNSMINETIISFKIS